MFLSGPGRLGVQSVGQRGTRVKDLIASSNVYQCLSPAYEFEQFFVNLSTEHCCVI